MKILFQMDIYSHTHMFKHIHTYIHTHMVHTCKNKHTKFLPYIHTNSVQSYFYKILSFPFNIMHVLAFIHFYYNLVSTSSACVCICRLFSRISCQILFAFFFFSKQIANSKIVDLLSIWLLCMVFLSHYNSFYYYDISSGWNVCI